MGKTTIARLFAELVISASDQSGRHPNVLIIDFDVDHRGLTVSMASNIIYRCSTVHEQIATNTAAGADAVDVSTAVSLHSGTIADRGRLYLMPSAPKEATNVFRVIADIDVNNLLGLLADMIQSVVDRYGVSCVVIDCGPVVNPYTAAAAQLSTAAFIVGQNEPITYDSIDVQKARIREMYPNFNSAKLKVIINKVRGYEQLEMMRGRREIFFDIPFTIDVVDASEGIKNVSELRTLLFENHIVELIGKVLIGHPELTPPSRVLLDENHLELLSKARQLEQSPRMKNLKRLGHLKLVGIILFVLGVCLLAFGIYLGSAAAGQPVPSPDTADARGISPGVPTKLGVALVIAGITSFAAGWYAAREWKRLRKAIVQLIAGGPDGLFDQIKKGPASRGALEELQKMTKSVA